MTRRMTLWSRRRATFLLLLHVLVFAGVRALDDVVCETDCTEYCRVQSECKPKCCAKNCNLCTGGLCTSCISCDSKACGVVCDPGEVDELCVSRCEIKNWLQCSSGFGGCQFHRYNGHFELAQDKIDHLSRYGLNEHECLNALHTGELPEFLGVKQCNQCESTFDEVQNELSYAAQLAMHSDEDIVWTPKEALLHLQRCACKGSPAPGEEITVTKFSIDTDDKSSKEDDDEDCLWYAWFQSVSGGGAAYTVSSTTEDFKETLEEYQKQGYHLVSSEWAGGAWIAWWEVMPSDSLWVMEESTEDFLDKLEIARMSGYAASTITYGSGVWFAWLWNADGAATSRFATSPSISGLLKEMNTAVDSRERLQAIAYGKGEWIAWFSSRVTDMESYWIVTPKYEDFVDFNTRMKDEGYFSTASSFADGSWVAWFDYNPNGAGDYVAEPKDLSFLLSLREKLDQKEMMPTTISHGCFGQH